MEGGEEKPRAVEVNQIVKFEHDPQMEEPEKNNIEYLGRLMYMLGLVTDPTGEKTDEQGQQIHPTLPLAVRALRADTYKSVQDLRKQPQQEYAQVVTGKDDEGKLIVENIAVFRDTKKEIKEELGKAKLRKELALQYLENQYQVTVDMPELGKQMARMVHLNPPNRNNEPPYILISTIAGDPAPVATLALELASRGNEVIILGYPEASMGRITEAYSKKASEPLKEDQPLSFSPQTDFFKQVIRELSEKYGKYDSDTKRKLVRLSGLSTGSVIGTEILTDPEFQKITESSMFFSPSALFFSPPAVVKQKPRDLIIGSVKDFASIANLEYLRKYSFIWGEKNPQGKEQKALKDAAFSNLLNKLCNVAEFYRDARVAKGKITYVSGGKDDVTKSRLGEDFLKQNPQVQIVPVEDAHHSTPLVDSQYVMDTVEAALRQ